MSKRSILLSCLVVVGVLGAVVFTFLIYGVDRTGLKESITVSTETIDQQGNKSTTQIYQRTVWDWMDLLIIPLVLGVGLFLLNKSEQRQQAQTAAKRAETDRYTAEERLQEEALQSYLDNMTQLLLEKDLRKSGTEDEVSAVARVRTLTILRRLNGERKGLVVRFLYESELIQDRSDLQQLAVVDLTTANLRMVYLRGANLRGADLNQANLSGAVYNDATQWPDGYDPVAAGAMNQTAGRRLSS